MFYAIELSGVDFDYSELCEGKTATELLNKIVTLAFKHKQAYCRGTSITLFDDNDNVVAVAAYTATGLDVFWIDGGKQTFMRPIGE